MGLYDDDSSVRRAEGELRNAEKRLQSCKAARESAKQGNNYKNSIKNIRRSDGRVGNWYDDNVWMAEDEVKRKRAMLAEAKRDAAEAKKKRAAKEREEKKEKAAKEREEAAKRRAAEKSSRSSSRSSSSSYSSSSYDDDYGYDDDYSNNDDYSNDSCSSSETSDETTFASIVNNTKALMAAGTLIESYQNSLNIKYSLEDANEIQIIMWLQELSNESSRLNKLYNESETNIDSYAISGCMRVVDELCDTMGNKLKEIFIGKYTKHIKNTYPFETASDSDLVIMIAGLVCEIKKQEIECLSNKNMDILFSIYSQQKQIAHTAATNACLRLEKLNRSLYNSPEVQEWVQQIDPNLKGGFLLAATRLRTQLAELKDRPKVIVEQFQNDIEERFSKWMDAIKAKSEKITEKIQSLVDSFNK